MKLRKCLVLISLLIAISAMAVPALREKRAYMQPDGTEVTLELVGDEWCHYYLTEDGYMVIGDNKSGYNFATTDTKGNLIASPYRASDPLIRHAAVEKFLGNIDKEALNAAIVRKASGSRRNAMQVPNNVAPNDQKGKGKMSGSDFKTSDSPRCLIILVQYQDVSFTLGNNAYSYFNNMLNQEGFSQYSGTGSVKEYFTAASNGNFTPVFDVYGPITLSQNRAYYGGNDSSGNDLNPAMMVVEACQQLDNQGVDFSIYDYNNDGYVDNVFVFFAGQGEASYGPAESVWPHQWYVYWGAGVTCRLDGKLINRYGCTNEWGKNTPDGIGTFCHEFSHVLGLPDLYAVNGTAEAQAITPHSYDIMAYGNYSNNGRTPPTYSTFERNALGWIDLTVLNPGQSVDGELPHLETSNKGYLIPTSSSNEFFLLENRQKQGWDSYIPGHGMLIWHIDYNSTVWSNQQINTYTSHQYVDIEEANNNPNRENANALAGYPFPGTSGNTSFTDDTTPSMKTWSNVGLNTPITDIRETAAGVITFKSCAEEEESTPGKGSKTFDFYNLWSQNNTTGTWGSGYTSHTATYTEGSVEMTASQQSGTITTYPVTKGSDVTVRMNNDYQPLTSVTLNCLQWGSNAQTITLEASTDGTTFNTVNGVSSSNFVLTCDNLPYGTKAVKFKFSNTSKQVGLVSIDVSYDNTLEPPLPQLELPVMKVNGTAMTSATASYCNPVTVSLENPTVSDAEIWYTCNAMGVELDIYSKPFRVDKDTEVEYLATKDGYRDSETAKKTLTFYTSEAVITPGSGEYDEMPQVTVTSATQNADIYYTLDGSDPTTSSTKYTGPFTPEGDNVTVKAIAKFGSWSQSSVSSATFTVKAKEPDPQDPEEPGEEGDTYYKLVTATSELTDGDKIVIVSATKDYALGPQATNNRRGVEVSVNEDNEIHSLAEGVAVLTLEEGTQSGKTGFYLKAADEGYLYASSSSKNNLNTQANPTVNALAVITVNSTSTSVKFEASSNRSVMQYNPNNESPIFSCYASASQTGVLIFKEMIKSDEEDPEPQEPTEHVATPSITPESGEYESMPQVNISCVTEGATIYYTTEAETSYPEGTWTTYEAAFTPEGESVTIRAIAVKEGMLNSGEATATYTVKASEPDPEEEDPEPSTLDEIVFDFTGETAYGMTLLSGSTTNYNPEAVECTEEHVTLNINGQTRWWQASSGNELRFYKSSNFTVTAPEGSNILSVALEGATNSHWNTSVDGYNKGTWTGSTESVTFNNIKDSGNTAVKKVKVKRSVIAPTFSITDHVFNHASDKSITLSCIVRHSRHTDIKHYDIWVAEVEDNGSGVNGMARVVPEGENIVGSKTVTAEDINGADNFEVHVPLTGLSADSGVHSVVIRAHAVMKDDSAVNSSAYTEGDVHGSTGETVVDLDTSLEGGTTTGITGVVVDNDMEPQYYNMQGLRVENPASGIYIMRIGAEVRKVVIK